jgi:hypothetical protein
MHVSGKMIPVPGMVGREYKGDEFKYGIFNILQEHL